MTTIRGYHLVSRILTAMLACAVAMTFVAGPAQASCASPRISSSATNVTRGETITVKGDAWGTGCNDTNRKPGQPALGAPKTDIVIEIVQDGKHVVLAKGNATNSYSFTVQLVVPSTLQPGTATLTAGTGTGPVELTVSNKPPVAETRGAVVRFGPTGQMAEPNVAPAEQPTGSSGSAVWWIVVAVIALGAGALVLSRKIASSKPHQDS